MCCILRLLCCCCCSDNKDASPPIKTLGALPSKTAPDQEKKANLAVLEASTVTSVNTLDLTQVYEIPNRKFRAVYDCVKYNGYEIDWTVVIGKGKYGTVYKAIHVREQTVVAVKVMTTDIRNEAQLKDNKNELFIMEKTSHPHIIKVFKHFIIKDKINHKYEVFIFIRFAENKSLSDYIRTKQVFFEEPDAKRMFAQIVSAVDHMHSLGIAHRDLKLSNVLLDKDLNAMVSDFGLSRVLYDYKGKHLRESNKRVGTRAYFAPEILLMETNKKPYDPFAADIWALGVILWCMINRTYPFGDKPETMIKSQIKFDREYIKVCRHYEPSTDLVDIIQRIFRFDRYKRITHTELIKQKWIKDEIQIINDKINAKNLMKKSLTE